MIFALKSGILLIYVNNCVRTHVEKAQKLCAHTVKKTTPKRREKCP